MTAFDEQLAAAEIQWAELYGRGPERTRWTDTPLQEGDQAPDFQRLDSAGNTVQLKDFWAENPALILFWRHYGCGCGLDRAERLNNEIADYQKAGANVVIVGQGEPERAAYYAMRYKLEDYPILCDPSTEAYFAYGLLEGKETQVLFDAPNEFLDRDPEAGKRFVKERQEMGRPLVDNPWLLPGEFVVDTNGIVRLAYRYNFCEDFPDARVHLAAIREAHLAVK